MPEKINTTVREQTRNHEQVTQEPSARERLLASPEWATVAEIPGNTVVLRANLDLLKQTDFQLLSEVAQEVADEDITRLNDQRDIATLGYGKLASDISMSRLDTSLIQPALRKEKVPDTLTLLYDGENVDLDGKTKIPSAILVHESMNEKQLKELRELLPAGVPLLDAKTNRLLDETGQAEREMLHKKQQTKRKLGRQTLLNFYKERSRQYDAGFYVAWDGTTEREAPRSDDSFSWMGWDESIKAEQQYAGQQSADEDDSWYERVRTTSPPESEEVRSHRERVNKAEGLLNDAAAKYGASDWQHLDPRDQDRVRRQVLRDLHPDREGGDKALFQEVEFMTRNIERPTPKPETPEPQAAEAERAEPEAGTDTEAVHERLQLEAADSENEE